MARFGRGIWGSGKNAAAVDADEHRAIAELVSKASGHTIIFGGVERIAIFTQIGDMQVIELRQSDKKLGRKWMYMHTNSPKKVIRLAKRINDLSSRYRGLEYIIYKSNSICSPSPSNSSCEHMCGYVPHLEAYSIPFAYVNPQLPASEVPIGYVSQIELYDRCCRAISLRTYPIRTYVFGGGYKGWKGLDLTRFTIGTSDAAYDRIRKALINKVGRGKQDLYVFSVSCGDGTILPHIYEPHLKILRGIVLSDKQIEYLIAARNPPANDADITYDD